APGDFISCSFFFHIFTIPLEMIVNSASKADLRRFTYANAKNDQVYGVEIEFRKNLGFLAPESLLEHFILFSNASYIKSTVDIGVLGGNPDRALQGQSPYLINAGLQYTSQKKDFSFNVLY